MINISFKKNSGKLVFFNIAGHADFDKYNRDIVCCAVSVVSQTTLIGIQEVLKIDAPYSIKDGFLSVNIENMSPGTIDQCQVLLNTMLLGLQSIELSYGKYIKVEVEEV